MRYRMGRRFTDYPVGVIFFINELPYRRKPNGIIVRCRGCTRGLIFESFKRRQRKRAERRSRSLVRLSTPNEETR